MLPSGNENSERESNPIPESVYMYLSGSVLVVSLSDPHKQLPDVKYVFKFPNYGYSLYEIYRFITFQG